MQRIRTEQAFTLFANCTVSYSGRAESILDPGNYLILHKSDGTLLIHGGTLCTPRNYQGPGSILDIEGDKLISKRKGETITIQIHKIIQYNELANWSTKRIQITKTEKDLRDWIVKNLFALTNIIMAETHIEFHTPVGPVDILAIDHDQVYHVIEVKRGKANISACSQLDRYTNYFVGIKKNVMGYIASPALSKGAQIYLKDNGLMWLEAQHQ